MKLHYLALPLLLLFSACVHGDTKKDAALNTGGSGSPASAEAQSKEAVSIEAKLAGAQEGSSDVTEVKFEKGATQLSADYSDKIEKALIAAGKRAPVRHVSILTWSDQEMPAAGQPALGGKDIDLAKVRGESIRNQILAQHKELKTKIVNMAEKPSKFEKFLKTNDVRMQEALEGAGKGDPKASHAVIIIRTRKTKK